MTKEKVIRNFGGEDTFFRKVGFIPGKVGFFPKM